MQDTDIIKHIRRGNIEFRIGKHVWNDQTFYPFDIRRHHVNPKTKQAFTFFDFDFDRDEEDFKKAWREAKAWVRKQQTIDQAARIRQKNNVQRSTHG